jgi:hypothetical protein
MSAYSYEVIRWPFAWPATNLTLNKSGGGSTTITVAGANYLIDGQSVAAPVNFLSAVQTAINAGLVALGGTATVAVSMNTAGHVVFTTTVADGSRYTINLNTAFEAAIGATAANYFGGKLQVVRSSVGDLTMTYQAAYQWHPGIDADYDSGDLQRIILNEGRNLLGQPRRVRRDYAPWVERMLDWSRVAGGRMSTARAADADFATVAGITTGEDNTWENMWLYLAGEMGPYNDNRVYLYTTNDPSTALRQGPYDVILSASEPGLEGLPAGGYERGMASEYYPVKIMLREIT